MANAKRASMREGPLAALFRKTEELEGDDKDRAEKQAAAPAERSEPAGEGRDRGAPHPALRGGSPRAHPA
jgi:hypothetical protein